MENKRIVKKIDVPIVKEIKTSQGLLQQVSLFDF